MSKRLTTEVVVKRFLEKHNNFFNYSKVNYINNKTKVIIGCPIHGDFEQLPNDHLNMGGCRKCSRKKVSNIQIKDGKQFVEEATERHSDFYRYPNVKYRGNKVKVAIECPVHGEFMQTPNAHLKGQGCSKCGKEAHWRRSDYIKKAKGRTCTFYTLKCFNETEEFYKIGITMHSVNERYRRVRDMPYSCEIISEIKGEAGFIWDLEKEWKRKLKEFNYQPKIEFGGSKTECFTKYNI